MNKKTKILTDYFGLESRDDQKAVLNTLDALDRKTPDGQKIDKDSFLLKDNGTLDDGPLCEDATIITLTLEGRTLRQTANITHLDPKKVQERLSALGLDPACATTSRTDDRWTDEEEQRLLSLNAEGLSTYRIGKALERSSYACYRRLLALGATPNKKRDK